MKTKHTKGEWNYKHNSNDNCKFIIYNNQKHICTDVSDYGNPHNFEEAEANAKLIAATPELLEALMILQEKMGMLISLTPTGLKRNQLTEDNIKALLAIKKATE